MLTAEGCHARRDRLWAEMPGDVEWLLVGDTAHICYLSAFWVNPLSFSAAERALLLLRRDGTATLIADNFTRRSAVCDPFVSDEIVPRWYDHRHSVTPRDRALAAAIADLNLDPERGCIEGEAIPLQIGAGLAARTELGRTIRNLRRAKCADELALLSQCMKACAAGHARALEVIAAGMTDFELYREVQAAAQTAAGQPAVVYGDFRATSPDVPKAGGLPGGHVLEDGELFILDYSVVIHGYRSDFTNTLAVGEPTQQQTELFDACVRALSAAEAKLCAGAAAADVYQAASQVLVQSGFGELAHHAGHGLGLAHPEPPVFGPESTDSLVAGDVVTVEPGAYIPGVGGVRVEHNYAITADGSERLSHHRIALR